MWKILGRVLHSLQVYRKVRLHVAACVVAPHRLSGERGSPIRSVDAPTDEQCRIVAYSLRKIDFYAAAVHPSAVKPTFGGLGISVIGES